ncbi:ABC transporter permease [[Clostridium] aminophilum]|uniref:Oligopeptide transport system permease protein n=1 Tax=[Clostridium] aminophilum TaxID=1526 RepID=A0A1I6J8H4_9FIRM|nr:ABC transporter permease [[Clostridium] aminophilum]SFR75264.1 oligopeptide transport system permease protein [[Clostridium] aminophilum]
MEMEKNINQASDVTVSHIDASEFEHIGASATEGEETNRPSLTSFQDAVRRLKQNRIAMACLVVLLIMILMSVVAPMISPFDFREQHYSHTNAPMFTVCDEAGAGGFGHVHLFGTDTLGRDLFTRAWMGGRVSLTIAVVSAIVDLVLGAVYGGISGYFGGTADIIMMRILEIINGIPYLIIVILLMMILKPGMITIIVAYSLVGWIPMARLVRGQVVALKEQEFITAAKALGASPGRIIAKHLIPNTLSVMIVRVTLAIPAAIFSEAYLSYVGLGVQLPMCSWGSLAQLGIENFRVYPYQLMIPAICISLTMLAFNLFGDGLRDAFDPKLRR